MTGHHGRADQAVAGLAKSYRRAGCMVLMVTGPDAVPLLICAPRGCRQSSEACRVSLPTESNTTGTPLPCVILRTRLEITSRDVTMARHVQGYIDSLASRPNPTMAANVRECISVMLPSGLCSADHVALRLGVDRRTIHRHLAHEGETFSVLLGSVRAELVSCYINNRERPLTSVAELLGYSSLSAFSRWFHARFGVSASEWRAAQLGTSGVPTAS